MCASIEFDRVVRKMADARRWMRNDAARRWRRLGAGPSVAEGPRTVAVVSCRNRKRTCNRTKGAKERQKDREV